MAGLGTIQGRAALGGVPSGTVHLVMRLGQRIEKERGLKDETSRKVFAKQRPSTLCLHSVSFRQAAAHQLEAGRCSACARVCGARVRLHKLGVENRKSVLYIPKFMAIHALRESEATEAP